MNRPTKQEIKDALLSAGAVAVGFAKCDTVGEEEFGRWHRWVADGCHAGMAYMERNGDARRDPDYILAGARTVISVAFPYLPSDPRALTAAHREGISLYAMLPDYHDWIRQCILQTGLGERWGEEYRDWRICIDSAPVFERHWAQISGVGVRGRNGMIITPRSGARTLLGEIFTTSEYEPDAPAAGGCQGCGACTRICPTGALHPDGTVDARRCLSYLTIEHRGDWRDPVSLEALAAARHRLGRIPLFGCDLCVEVCPHNREATATAPVAPHPAAMTLTRAQVTAADPGALAPLLAGSPLSRAKRHLRRNAESRSDVPWLTPGFSPGSLATSIQESRRDDS